MRERKTKKSLEIGHQLKANDAYRSLQYVEVCEEPQGVKHTVTQGNDGT